MKNRKKSIISLAILITCLSGTTFQAVYGESESIANNKNIESRFIGSEYWAPWVITSKKPDGIAYGGWSRVGEARGAGNGGSLRVSSQKSTNNTYSGTLKVTKSVLENSLGYSFSSGSSRTAEYTISATNPKKTYWVNCRNIYAQTKVNQQSKYMVNGRPVNTSNKTVYAKKWTGFGYNWGTK